MSKFTDANIISIVSGFFTEDKSWQGFIYSVIALFVGLFSTIISRYIDKRKTPKEKQQDEFKNMTDASTELIANARSVSDMARDLLKDQEDIFQKKIELAISSAKDDCSDQIASLKDEYQNVIATMGLQIKILQREKDELTKKIDVLEKDNKILSEKVLELQTRLKKYEKTGTGPLSDKTIKE